MSSTYETFDEKFKDLIAEAASHELASEDGTTAMRNLAVFSKCRPPEPETEPEPEPVIELTGWAKVKSQVADVWNNETTRVAIKAVSSFAGVALVAYATIQRDHVLGREALSQANQRTS